MVALNFDARTVAPNTGAEALPAGTYPVMISGTEEKPNKARNGSYLEITMTVQGGEYANRKITERLNLKNQSPQAVEIAYGTLSTICHCAGILVLQDTQQLHGKMLQVSISKVPRDDNPGAYSNNVTGYLDMQGRPAQQGQAGAGGGAPMGGQQQMQQGGYQGQPQQGGYDPNAGQGGNWQGGGQMQGQPQFQQGQMGGQPQFNGQQQGYVDPNAGQFQQQGQPQFNPQQGQMQQGGQPQFQQNGFDPNAGQMQQGQPQFQQGQQMQGQPQMQQGGAPTQNGVPSWVGNQ